MKNLKIFIDESGQPEKTHPSKLFTLVGCIIDATKQDMLKQRADQIKFKYWGNTPVVLHSELLGKNLQEYSIFNDKTLKEQFYDDLFTYLHAMPIVLACSIVDKTKVYAGTWTRDTILKKTTDAVFSDFVAYIFACGATGKVAFEASSYQKDSFYLKAYNTISSPNWEKSHPNYHNVREKVTSITFANKLNHDTETQLADMFGYAAVCKYNKQEGIKAFAKGSYEDRLITLFDKKLICQPATALSPSKKVFYDDIGGFNVFPKQVSHK